MKENKLLISVFLGSLIFLVLSVVAHSLVPQYISDNPTGMVSQVTGFASADVNEWSAKLINAQDNLESLRAYSDYTNQMMDERWEKLKQEYEQTH